VIILCHQVAASRDRRSFLKAEMLKTEMLKSRPDVTNQKLKFSESKTEIGKAESRNTDH
jgi:hypothetical protein